MHRQVLEENLMETVFFTEFIQEIDHDQIILEEQQRMRNAGIGFSETKQCGFRDAYVMGV